MEPIINEITKEVSIYISVGLLVKDLTKHDDYEVKEVRKYELILEHKPFLRSEKKDDLTVGYDELVYAFSVGRFYIQGFSTIVEGGYKHDLDKLKRAVKDTVERIRMEDEERERQRVEARKSELEREREEAQREKEEILKEKALLEQEKVKVLDEKESLVQKRKTKLRAKLTRKEEEERRETEKINKRIAHEHKIKILNKKKESQQQRFRLLNKQI